MGNTLSSWKEEITPQPVDEINTSLDEETNPQQIEETRKRIEEIENYAKIYVEHLINTVCFNIDNQLEPEPEPEQGESIEIDTPVVDEDTTINYNTDISKYILDNIIKESILKKRDSNLTSPDNLYSSDFESEDESIDESIDIDPYSDNESAPLLPYTFENNASDYPINFYKVLMSESSGDEYNGECFSDEYNSECSTDEYNDYPSEDDFSKYQHNIIYPDRKYQNEINKLRQENEQLKDELDNLFFDYQKLKIKHESMQKIKVD